MPAFNARLRPKEIFGYPMVAVFAAIAALILATFSMLLPWVMKAFTIPLMLVAIFVSVRTFILGDEIQWVPVMRQAKREENRVTSEVIEEEE